MKAILLLVLGGVILGWVLGAIVPLHGVITVIIIKVNTQITKKGKIKITNLDNFLLYRIVKVFYFI